MPTPDGADRPAAAREHAAMYDHDDLARARWRTGRSLGRTVYAVVGDQASKDDVLLGFMETAAPAAFVTENPGRGPAPARDDVAASASTRRGRGAGARDRGGRRTTAPAVGADGVTAASATRCPKCHRPTTRRRLRNTLAGTLCPTCVDRLPSGRRRPPRATAATA
jgi:hypothetical protein